MNCEMKDKIVIELNKIDVLSILLACLGMEHVLSSEPKTWQELYEKIKKQVDVDNKV